MINSPHKPPSYGLNDLGEYQYLGRGPVTSYFRRVVAPFVPSDAGTLRRLAAFSSNIRNWRKWAGHVMRYVASPKHEFLNYGTESGVYALDDSCTFAIAGEWGTGTDEAQHVTSAIKKNHNPNYTVHLGDVYYVGDQPELEENCLGQDGPPINGVVAKGVKWELGTKGSFALNGNHAMYACGDAYFDKFLPKLGTLDPAGKPQGQKASFFCLRNKYWRIVGLDTGYYSTGIRTILSFLSRIKKIQWLRKTSWFKPSCKLHDDVMRWLSNVLRSAPANTDSEIIVPVTILLSHHEYYSSFDDWYPIPGQQLRRLISPDRPVLWRCGLQRLRHLEV